MRWFKRDSVWAVFIALATVSAAGACDGESPSQPTGIVPTITAVEPAAIQPSGDPQRITVSGELFVSGLTLVVTSPADLITRLSGSAIQGFASTGFQVDVLFDVEGDYTLVYEIPTASSLLRSRYARHLGPTAPVVTGISPATVVRGPQFVQVTLLGRNFTPDVTISMTPPSGTVVTLPSSSIVSISPTEIRLQLVFDTAGAHTFIITNPAGESSAGVVITVI